MIYEHYDFTRNPIVEDHVFFLESKCIRCGFTVLAPSVEELVEAGKKLRRNAHQPLRQTLFDPS
jgi:hypothetical protein